MLVNVIRTLFCGEVSFVHVEQNIIICGWVHFIRNFGKVIFFYIRDSSGFVQVVIDSSNFNLDDFDIILNIKREYVIQVFGIVNYRKNNDGTIRHDQIEIVAFKVIVISECVFLPFYPDDYCNISEEVRLKYRYIDLRRRYMQFNLKKRSEAIKFMRYFLYENNFIEIETPILTKSTPEGARDYVVPSRINIGSFFSLPQSPQIFKQLLVIGGVDRYYQVAKCFRDEDLRSDRQPEFTQLDLELSFINENYIMSLIEKLLYNLFHNLLNVFISYPFFKFSYKRSIFYFRSDKPDYRNSLKFFDISNFFYEKSNFIYNGFYKNINKRVLSLIIKNFFIKDHKINVNNYIKFLNDNLIKNFIFFNILERNDNKFKIKFLNDCSFYKDFIDDIAFYLNCTNGDLILIIFDDFDISDEILSYLLQFIWSDICLFFDQWYFSWIIDFPLFSWDSLSNKWVSTHHPFTSPQNFYDCNFIYKFPGDVLSRSYDLVMNGIELGGGSIRINNFELQECVLRLLGMSDKNIEHEFGFLINSLKSGSPIFGGIALGLDRLLMILTNSKSIRDIIAFPKTQSANCLLTGAPSLLSFEQLDILGINISLKY